MRNEMSDFTPDEWVEYTASLTKGPLISVYTPTHNTKFLLEAYSSLVAQTHMNWEWVILLNGDATTVPFDVRDERVIIERTTSSGIGRLKSEAVKLCTGGILLELDHDDVLLPDALLEVHRAFRDHANVDFVYSDTAQINEDGSVCYEEFSADYGWEYYTEDDYHVTRSFKPYPHNVSYIWYAPNHLRAFRRDAYDAAGGYDEALTVCDDQDLMARLYQRGEFYHIPHVLYLQRIHAGNSQRDPQLNDLIQRQTRALYHSDVERNALAWAKRQGLLALDLGAFHAKPEGYLGVDTRHGPNVDYCTNFLDLELPDNSVGVIRAVDFLEHVPDRIRVMEKIWRLLAHGGMLLSDTPSTDGRGAWQDPTHVSGWNENSFWYFTDDRYRAYIESEAKFHASLVYSYHPTPWHVQMQIPYVRANLVAIKDPAGDRFGGPNHI